jgi:hypothetical protein
MRTVVCECVSEWVEVYSSMWYLLFIAVVMGGGMCECVSV